MKKTGQQYLSSGRPALVGATQKEQFARQVHFDPLDHYELAQLAAGQGNNKAAMSHLQQITTLMRMTPQQHLDSMNDHLKLGNGGAPRDYRDGHLDASLNHAYLYGVKTGNFQHYTGDATPDALNRAHEQFKTSGMLTGAAHVHSFDRT